MTPDREAFAQRYLGTLTNVLRGVSVGEVARVIEYLERAWTERRQIFLIGNGGSASTASHMANDLMKGVAKGGGRGFRVLSLTDSAPLLTAIANDEEYAEVFAGQLKELAQPGDVLILISGSGNSPNLLRAIDMARTMGLATIGLLGRGGGRLKPLVDAAVVVPSDAYGPIEDVHLALNHLLTTYFASWAARRTTEVVGVNE